MRVRQVPEEDHCRKKPDKTQYFTRQTNTVTFPIAAKRTVNTGRTYSTKTIFCGGKPAFSFSLYTRREIYEHFSVNYNNS